MTRKKNCRGFTFLSSIENPLKESTEEHRQDPPSDDLKHKD